MTTVAHVVYNIAGNEVDLTPTSLPSFVLIEHEVPEAYKKYADLRTELKDFDATVVVGDQKIHGHKALLSARVPFFRGLFETAMVESVSGEVTINQFDYNTVKALLDYVYTGKLYIDGTNVQDLLMGANFLGIEPVQLACGKFMVKRLRVENGLALWTVCRSIGYHQIDDQLLRFVDKNFVSVSHTPEFLNLSAAELEDLLIRNSLNVDDEKQVFDSITRWMGENEEQRKQHAVSLLRCVRCTRIPEEEIAVVLQQTPWVAYSQECMDLLEKAKEYHTEPAVRRDFEAFETKERRCDDAHNLIFAVGWISSTQNPETSTMEFYDPILNKWTKCKNLPGVRGRNGVAVFARRKIYAIGGNDGKERLKTCDVYDTETDQWSQAPELLHHRGAMATAVIDGKIYVAGGYDGTNSLDSMEMLNPSDVAPEWASMPSMTKLRGAPASCILDGKFYVIGGHDGQQNIHKDGEYFSPETKTWTAIAPMKHKRSRFGAAVYKGQIYVAGGFDGAAFLRDFEVYDPPTNTWTTLKIMKERRSRCSLAVSCGKLFAIGGFDGLNNISSVEMYTPETNTWVSRGPMTNHSGGIFLGCVPIPATIASPVANLEEDDIVPPNFHSAAPTSGSAATDATASTSASTSA